MRSPSEQSASTVCDNAKKYTYIYTYIYTKKNTEQKHPSQLIGRYLFKLSPHSVKSRCNGTQTMRRNSSLAYLISSRERSTEPFLSSSQQQHQGWTSLDFGLLINPSIHVHRSISGLPVDLSARLSVRIVAHTSHHFVAITSDVALLRALSSSLCSFGSSHSSLLSKVRAGRTF